MGFPGGTVVKNMPASLGNAGHVVWSLSQEDLLEKEMANHSSILAWKIPCMEEPGKLQSMWLQRVGHDWATELNGKNSEPQWSKRLHAQSLSCVSLFVTLWTVAHQALLSMEFSRQEYWSGLPFSPPRGLPNPGIKSTSPSSVLASRFFNTEPTWEAPNQKVISVQKNYICLISSSILQENKI